METMDLSILMLLVGLSGFLLGYWLSASPVSVSWQPVLNLSLIEQAEIQACKMEYILRCLRYIHHRIIARTGTDAKEDDHLLKVYTPSLYISFKGEWIYASTYCRSSAYGNPMVLYMDR